MFDKFNLADKILFTSAFLSLIYSEVLFFNGDYNQAIFVGIWVPSLLISAVFLKLLNKKRNG